MIPKATQLQLDDLAHQYANQLLADVKQVFSTPQYRNSGELSESLTITVSEATDTESPTILLKYADQGFYLGYKNPQWTQLPNIEKLKKWAAKRDLSDGDIPGYSYGTASRLTEEQKVSRIVWAIAKNKRKHDTWKQKKWKNAANLGDLLTRLNAETLVKYAKEMEKILADSITNGTVLS